MKRHPSRRGIALIEMMLAVILLAAFSLVTAKLFHAVSLVSADAAPRPLPDRAVMRSLQSLRDDVWNAVEIKVVGDKELQLSHAFDRGVVWTIGAAGMKRVEVLRGQAGEAVDVAMAHVPTGFEPLPGGVRVTMPQAHLRGDERVFSQLQLFRGVRR